MEAQAQILCKHCGLQTSKGDFCCAACEILHGQFEPSKESASTHSFLDQPNFKSLYLDSNSEFQYHLSVQGMHCSSCVHLLEQLPKFDDSVVEARVQFSQSRLSLKVKSNFSLSRTVETLKNWGYESQFIIPNSVTLDPFLNENRKSLKRIAVAGTCAGNIMLFVIPIYAGLSGSLSTLFNWMCFFLFLPILFYSASGFYQGAWNSLRYKVLNIDLPIVVALWTGFLLSTFNLIEGDPHIYYDSTASFIFLILSTRHLLKKVQQNYLSPLRLQNFLQSQKVTAQRNSQWLAIPFLEVAQNDLLKIEKGQTLPTDVLLLSQNASLDLSTISGESFPKTFSKGMTLLAGSTNLGEEIQVQVLNPPEKSILSKILFEIENNSLKKNSLILLTDQLAQKLIVSVFAISVGFFCIYSFIDLQEAFNRSLALIVLACPCALAFGTPLTYGLALKKAQKKGIFIKNSAGLEKILNMKNIFFDKTGTLTEGRLKLIYSEPAEIDEKTKSLLLSLELGSIHPIAFALREVWKDTPLLEVQDKVEILGQGVQGKINQNSYKLQALSESVHEDYLAIALFENETLVCRLYFEDPIRQDAKEIVESFRQEKKNCFILSGDKKERVLKIAKLVGIPESQSFSGLYPEDKKNYVSATKDSCMIGDGANDALALSAADVGIGVSNHLPLSLQASDIYFLRGGLRPLQDLMDLAKKTQTVLYRNLTLSLLYNFIGGVLALSGFINPLAAAILMPLSSLLIVLSTLWGLK